MAVTSVESQEAKPRTGIKVVVVGAGMSDVVSVHHITDDWQALEDLQPPLNAIDKDMMLQYMNLSPP